MEIIGKNETVFTNYSSVIKLNQDIMQVTIDIDFKASCVESEMRVELLEPEKVLSASGKSPSNRFFSIDLPPYSLLSPSEDSFLSRIGNANRVISLTTIAIGTGAVIASSFCTSFLIYLAKMVQIVEFISLMEYYNIPYDQNLAEFLRGIGNLSEFEVLKSPTRNLVTRLDETVAGKWKGKPSRLRMEPLLFQNLGYLGISMMVSLAPS